MSDCGDLYPLPAWKSRIDMSGVASWYVMVSFLLPSDHDNNKIQIRQSYDDCI